ncbi:MAG: hypothetical protein AB7O47_09715 [Flavobacteriales bacterium]
MKLNLVLTTLSIVFFSFTYAQKSEKIIKQPTPYHATNLSQNSVTDTINVVNPNTRTPQFSTSSVENALTNKNQSLLQELYSLEDERNIIDKDNSLSSSERRNRIDKNNSKYNLKKAEFIEYVNSKGILNVSKQEQSYFLSILKSSNNMSEYNKNMELIKQSK